MKQSIFHLMLLSLLFTSCKNEEKKAVLENNIPNLDWLLGDWTRTNDTDGRQTYEHWKKINDSTYSAHGYTLLNEDTVWQEWAVISPVGLDWYFQARMKDDSESTNFLFTEQTDTSFVCQNPDNEFPKVIKYWKNGDQLFAEISSDEDTIPFEFERK